MKVAGVRNHTGQVLLKSVIRIGIRQFSFGLVCEPLGGNPRKQTETDKSNKGLLTPKKNIKEKSRSTNESIKV